MGALAKVQAWTQPVWIIGMVLPFVVLAFEAPDAWGAFGSFGGTEGAGPGFSWVAFGLGTGVALSGSPPTWSSTSASDSAPGTSSSSGRICTR